MTTDDLMKIAITYFHEATRDGYGLDKAISLATYATLTTYSQQKRQDKETILYEFIRLFVQNTVTLWLEMNTPQEERIDSTVSPA